MLSRSLCGCRPGTLLHRYVTVVRSSYSSLTAKVTMSLNASLAVASAGLHPTGEGGDHVDATCFPQADRGVCGRVVCGHAVRLDPARHRSDPRRDTRPAERAQVRDAA